MNDTKIIAAMNLYGSSFEKALAHAAMEADSTNLWAIKGAFPDLWEEYSKVAERSDYQSQYKGESMLTPETVGTRPILDSEKFSPFGYRSEPPEEGEI